ncbi:class I SAM-dependent methyltransferase [Xanthovirga aplysinae]|uniref:class I SAM-dependent methyltransferase n=1 Tax=Xanthovirga aplysinae TaxID=2529853 RepID=UPI0012BD7E9F|nr:class I SAM-dependent methyltransferase [Xanthovirga aplysinae]MTI32449.1 class I SAM-dependent methyltransferase [Xanthovirga aplysinae]
MKQDYFSDQAAEYARFRPTYPKELYASIFSYVRFFDAVWDCGTGNGQVALELAKHFKVVKATDISAAQIQRANRLPNIEYICCPAEKSPFPAKSFDLITVATALHWFDLPSYWREVSRVGKKGAILAVWFYSLIRITPEIDKIADNFCYNLMKKFWPPERQHVNRNYDDIVFPFQKVQDLTLENKFKWSRDHFLGYLESWSSVQQYMKRMHANPLNLIKKDLFDLWPETKSYEVNFPVILKIFKI